MGDLVLHYDELIPADRVYPRTTLDAFSSFEEELCDSRTSLSMLMDPLPLYTCEKIQLRIATEENVTNMQRHRLLFNVSIIISG